MVTEILRKQARKVVGQIGRAVLANQPARRVANLVYEHGTPGIQNLFVRLIAHAGVPDNALEWTIELASGARVVVPVRPGDLPGWQFAQSYKWHDRGLRRTEAALLELVPRAGRLFDVGANMGLRSIYALAQGRPVTMFEPNPALRAFTEALLLRNHFERGLIENVCVGGHEGTARFYVSRSSYLSSLDRAHAAGEGDVQEIEVPVTTLDRYVAADPSTRSCAVLKIDVEGAELEVLSGAAKVLETLRPCILIEARARTTNQVNEHLSKTGYLGFGIAERESGILLPVDARGGVTAAEGEGSSNFLYLPMERTTWAKELVRKLGRA